MYNVICEICGKTFLKKFSLHRHVKSIHQSLKFKCEICDKEFNREDILKRHKPTHDAKPDLICHYCRKIYKHKGLLTLHINARHLNVNLHRKKKKKRKKHVFPDTFECNECGKKFLHRQSIIVHFSRFHGNVTNIFECEECNRPYKHKKDLNRHIRSVHQSNDNLTCVNCKRSFQSKNWLETHSLKCSKVSEYIPTYVCVKCGGVFSRKCLLLQHYSDEHNVALIYENYQFNSLDEFQKWKKEMEFFTIAAYNSCNTKETIDYWVRKLRCHRSGVYIERCKSNKRINQLKKKGTKKLQGFCPAEICVREKKSDQKCLVTFQKTHVGHEIGTENELCHIYLDQTKRLELTMQLAANIPLHTILKNENESILNGKHDNRRREVTRRDLRNIRYHYLSETYPIIDDSVNIPIFIQQNKNSVLYYKYKNESTFITTLKNIIFPFQPEDFVLVFMNVEQKQTIELFARNRVVTFDAIPCSNPEKYILHTMMVFNYDHEGLPVAFLLTNRNDETVITCFIECIKMQVGELNVKTLMTNIQPVYYNAWISVMPQPLYYLHCIWHVNEEWKRQYQQVSRNKRGKLRIALYKLQQELDEYEFEKMLVVFTNQKEPCYQNFLKYFNLYFAHEAKRWAYCYRAFAQINTNTHLEYFHEHLKKNCFGRKTHKSVAACLHDIKNYISLKFHSDNMKEINEHMPVKLKLLNKRHIIAVEELKSITIVDCDEFDVWNIISDGNVYTVRKQNPECRYSCSLKCAECNNVCLHEYACSCIDHAIKYNMCKHIHALVLLKWFGSEEVVTVSTLPVMTESPIPTSFEHSYSPITSMDKTVDLNKTRENVSTIHQDIMNKLDDKSLWLEYKKMLQAFSAKISSNR